MRGLFLVLGFFLIIISFMSLWIADVRWGMYFFYGQIHLLMNIAPLLIPTIFIFLSLLATSKKWYKVSYFFVIISQILMLLYSTIYLIVIFHQ